ncbi:MAG TPA: protein kinase [Myxococcaceae bacterium]|nr:protein kinase [Myxococcaceae bacterium]
MTLSSPLAPGTVIAGRFTLQGLAGRGGMGLVYQAHDSVSGHTVALKLLNASADHELGLRLTREAEVLSRLNHPGIVSYVAHGLTPEGQPFLAMEWLEGEDLARRLARQPLSLSDTLVLMRRCASVLSTAHAQGIIHRDIKPSNLYLRGGKVEDVVLLDFGLARLAATSLPPLTGSMAVLGTPGYMAPEQASSQEDISPAADIFSLGCVLYECLTAQAPFRAPHMAAVLAKILFAEPAPLRTVRPELPAALQALLDPMLIKAPERRLANGHHLVRALDGLGALPELPPPSLSAHPAPMVITTDTEQQLVSVVLATSGALRGSGPTLDTDETDKARARLEPLLQELQARGAKASLLADGSLLAACQLERGTATDLAALSAGCALAIKERWPESMVVLTTGLSLRGKPVPVGEVMDRAGEFLRRLESQPAAAAQVLVDETTAGLLGPRFELDKARSGTFLMRADQLRVDESRPLLGRPTPCVGREQELSLLEMAFVSCLEDASARALLVTAPAGTGKSRLRHEFLRRLERRAPPPLVLLGRADPMTARSAYGLLGHAVRQLCGVVDGEPLEARRHKLAGRLTRHLPSEQHKDTVEFLGELCGIAFPVEHSPRLRAAREDPQAMSLQVTRAMVALLRAELSQGPVLLVLEDLHWSDAPSVRLVDEVLRELGESPLLVLALARPEARELFPRLWPQHLQEVQLRGLSQKASTRLIQEVLGPQVLPAVVSRLVEQAAGNALFLEELIRGVAEGREGETPGTVLAMLQSRLQRLEPEPRRMLLASSIFGRTFWAGGVRALLEEQLSLEDLEHWLRHLTELELVEPQPGSRFTGERQYRFRHALVRDAAYSLVPSSLQSVSHRLAGVWLEQVGEQDPLVLAEHYQLGQDRPKAAFFFMRAGEQLFERQDLPGAQRCLEAALACEPQGDSLVAVRALDAAISFWRQDFARAYAVGSEVLPSLRPGSAAWGRVIGGMTMIGAQSGLHEDVAKLAARFLSASPDLDAMPIYIEAAAFLAGMNAWCGLRPQAAAVLARMGEVSRLVPRLDPISQGWLSCTTGYFEHFVNARPWHSRMLAETGTQAFLEVNSDRNQTATRTLLGQTLAALGDVPSAIEVMHQGLAGAQRAGQTYAITYTQMHLALVLVCSTEPAHHQEARQLALETLETEKVNVLHLGIAHLTLARVSALQGQWTEAEARARKAIEVLGLFRPYKLLARTTLCSVLMARQRAAEARAEAAQGVGELEQMGPPGAMAVGMRLALVEACFAQADQATGDVALRHALECVHLRASDIPDAEARERFLTHVPENARVRELARQRWGTDAP